MKSTTYFLLFSVLSICCSATPLYIGNVENTKKPLFQVGSRVAIFSFLMRDVSVSNSQGIDWLGKHFEKDYLSFHKELQTSLEQALKVKIVKAKKVKELAIYQDGYFPLKARFYLNSLNLPIISSQKEEELMLRTFNRLEADYYITLLIDHSIQKNILTPITTNSSLIFQLYHKQVGLIYQQKLESQKEALPYNRAESLGSLKRSYIKIVNKTLNQNNLENLKQLILKLKKDFPLVELKIQHSN